MLNTTQPLTLFDKPVRRVVNLNGIQIDKSGDLTLITLDVAPILIGKSGTDVSNEGHVQTGYDYLKQLVKAYKQDANDLGFEVE